MRDRRRFSAHPPIAAEVLEVRTLMSSVNLLPTFDLSDDSIQPNLTPTQPQTVPGFAVNISPGGPIGWKAYSIPVGTNYTGAMPFLAFVNDHDIATPIAQSQFRNVRIRETNTGQNHILDLEALEEEITPYAGSQDGVGDYAVQEIDGHATLKIEGNRWLKIPFNYTVTKYTVLEFEFRSDARGDVHGIGFSKTNDPDSRRVYKVYGTEAWGQRQFDNLYSLPASEVGQTLQFTVVPDNPLRFLTLPAISPAGVLTYTPAPGAIGSVECSVILEDSAGGVSDSREFDIVFSISGADRLPTLGHEHIPDFADQPTVIAIRDGMWHDPNVWSTGTIPQEGDIVRIDEPYTVSHVFGSGPTPPLKAIGVGGHLRSEQVIQVKDMIVYEDGFLELLPGHVTVFLNQEIDVAADPEQFGTGLLVFGKLRSTGTAKNSTALLMGGHVLAGQVALDFPPVEVQGWLPGDRILIPDTRQPDGKVGLSGSQDEARTVLEVQASGRVILDRPLLYDHKGAIDASGAVVCMPYVQNLTRDIVFRSETPAGTRGHILVTERADVVFLNTAMRDLGRTKTSPRDNTVFDEAGNVTHVGTNQLGRYPFHVHHLEGPEEGGVEYFDSVDHPRQFVVHGNAVDGGDAPHTFRWGLAVHASHFGQISENAIYNVAGAGIVTEDGSEYANTFERNSVFRITSTGKITEHDSKDAGDGGYGIWLRGPFNFVRDNVVGGAFRTAYYQLSRTRGNTTPASRLIPEYPGQGHHDYVLGPPLTTTPIAEFARNIAFSSHEAVELYRGNGEDPNAQASVIRDMVAWHVTWGIRPQYDMNLTIEGWTQFGDPQRMGNLQYPAIGIYGTMSYTHRVVANNVRIENMDIGVVHDGLKFGAYLELNQPYLRNRVNIQVTPGGVQPLQAPLKRTIIRSPNFGGAYGDGSADFDIKLDGLPIGADDLLLNRAEVIVYGLQPDHPEAISYIYYREQAATAVLPVHASIPVSLQGKTNQEAWTTVGKAFAGKVAPWSAIEYEGIQGLVEVVAS